MMSSCKRSDSFTADNSSCSEVFSQNRKSTEVNHSDTTSALLRATTENYNNLGGPHSSRRDRQILTLRGGNTASNNNSSSKSSLEMVRNWGPRSTFVDCERSSSNTLATKTSWNDETSDPELNSADRLGEELSKFPNLDNFQIQLDTVDDIAALQEIPFFGLPTNTVTIVPNKDLFPNIPPYTVEILGPTRQRYANGAKRKRYSSNDSTGHQQGTVVSYNNCGWNKLLSNSTFPRGESSCISSKLGDSVLDNMGKVNSYEAKSHLISPTRGDGRDSSSRSGEEDKTLAQTPSQFPGAHESKQAAQTPKLKSDEYLAKSGATRHSSNHTVYEFYPRVSVLNNDKLLSHCSFCFGRLSYGGIVCVSCNVCRYCNQDCQGQYFNIHKDECDLLEGAVTYVSAFSRALAHLYWKLLDCATGFESLTSGMQSIRSYSDELLNSETYKKSMEFQLAVLKKFFRDKFQITFNDVVTLYDKFLRCSMVISDVQGNYLGIGMYPGLDNFEHSCKPNANIVFFRNVMQVIVRNDRIAGSNLITVSFIDVINPMRKRHEALIPINGGICNCSRCMDGEFEKRVCGKMSDTTIQELLCYADAALELKGKAEELVGSNRPAATMKLKGAVLMDIHDYLKTSETVLGYFNHYRIRLLAVFAKYYKKLALFSEATSCYTELMMLYKDLLGECDARTISCKFQLGILLCKLQLTDEADAYFRMAATAARTAYGLDHHHTKLIRRLRNRVKQNKLYSMMIRDLDE